MDLSNQFEVNAGLDEAWIILNDVERIAPCLPGAQLTEIEGDEFRGRVKVKVGPITAQYKGKATFVEQNEAEHRVVINGQGRDTRGAGNANALITAVLQPIDDNTTRVLVDTDLTITGKVAQFGRGVMGDVSAKIMDQFAENLRTMLDEGQADAAPGDSAAAEEQGGPDAVGVVGSSNGSSSAEEDSSPGPESAADEDAPKIRKINMPEPEAVDLLDAAGAPVIKRAAPALAILLGLWILRRLFRKSGD